jgi:Na+-translocating ferredoxin:NAD+ oxidoreductase subunit G
MASKKESTFLSMTLTLLIVTSIAAFSLGGVYNLTKEKIEASKKEKLNKAIARVVPEFDNDISSDMYEVQGDAADMLEFYPAKNGDSLVGIAVKTYSDKGFSGRIWLMVGFRSDGTIINTAVLEHLETPGLGDKMDENKSDFPVQFRNQNPKDFKLQVKKDGGAVDAITAATISSRAFCDAVQRAYDAVQKNIEGGK